MTTGRCHKQAIGIDSSHHTHPLREYNSVMGISWHSLGDVDNTLLSSLIVAKGHLGAKGVLLIRTVLVAHFYDFPVTLDRCPKISSPDSGEEQWDRVPLTFFMLLLLASSHVFGVSQSTCSDNTVEDLCATLCVVVLVVQRSVDFFFCGRVCLAHASSSRYTHHYIVRKTSELRKVWILSSPFDINRSIFYIFCSWKKM